MHTTVNEFKYPEVKGLIPNILLIIVNALGVFLMFSMAIYLYEKFDKLLPLIKGFFQGLFQ